MKKITGSNDKKFGAFDQKDTSGMNLRTSPSFWIIAVSIEGKTSKIGLCPEKNTLPMKKLR